MGADVGICVVLANEASWEDLQSVFGTRGQAFRCQCQRYKLRPRESFGSFPAEERAYRLRQTSDIDSNVNLRLTSLVPISAAPGLTASTSAARSSAPST